jgi:hypothetical protein
MFSMKKIQIFALSIICYCFTCSLSVAQVTDNIATHLQDIDRILQPLDKSQIPTGILEDAGFGCLPLTKIQDTKK